MTCKDSVGQDLVPGDIVCASQPYSKDVLVYIFVGKKALYKCLRPTINKFKPFILSATVVKVNIEELKRSDKQYVINLLKLREEKYGNSRH